MQEFISQGYWAWLAKYEQWKLKFRILLCGFAVTSVKTGIAFHGPFSLRDQSAKNNYDKDFM